MFARLDTRSGATGLGEAVTPAHAESKVLWILRHDTHQVVADIVWTETWCELRLFSRGSLITWRRFARRSEAVAYADLFQQDFERAGWE